jgi:phosphatidate cytidylyltransferase
VFLPVGLTWLADTVAMAAGSLIGGRKLAPVLSPKKTWAGAIAGSVAALALAPVYGALVLAPLGVSLTLWQLVVFGGVISVVGQVGDAAESLFKREAGVKDSGAFFPGHGGVLDRLDSLYWVIPTAGLLLMWFGTL